MIIIRNTTVVKLITFGFAQGITLWPFIFIRKDIDKKWEYALINHESIHIKQQKELLLVGFYVLYIAWFLIDFFFHWDFRRAYVSIPFEMEAFSNQFEKEYLSERKRFQWITYI